MRAVAGGVRDAVELFSLIWCIFSIETLVVCGQKGDGCGHTVMSPMSGTMTSLNYPGTYPNRTQCEWSVRVPHTFTLLFVFGDFDLEWSPDCKAGSLTMVDQHGAVKLGPICGQMAASDRSVAVNSSEVTVRFESGIHRSGRGFLLSYSTNQHPDLISCLHRGSHFTSQQISVFCPGGCRDVAGEVWGQQGQGYRDTSVLCKAAIHAGVISDSQGGPVTVAQQRGITLYESSFANGVLSKTGSLSDKSLVFNRACDSVLSVTTYNASTNMEEVETLGWFPEDRQVSGQLVQWNAIINDEHPWLELELQNRSNITGIITKGLANFYIETYILMFSKDRKTWRAYKDAFSKVKKVFKAYSDGHTVALNSLVPPVAARYLQLRPQSWQGRVSAQVKVLGCPSLPVQPKTRGPTWAKPLPTEAVLLSHVSTESSVVITSSSSSQPLMLVVGVILGVALCVSCLAVVLVGLVWKRRKEAVHMKKNSLNTDSQGFHGKYLPYGDSELISYPLGMNVHGSLPNPPLNDYAEPDVLAGGQKVGVTFRPAQDEGYTVPFTLNHYDTPGQLPEYAEPLPPEPEYATPFGEQSCESYMPPQLETLPPNSNLLPGASASPGPSQYDCPAHRGLFNGYCTPLLSAAGPRRASAIYAEPQPAEAQLQHTYHEPL